MGNGITKVVSEAMSKVNGDEVLIAVKVPKNEVIWKILLACTSDPMPAIEAEWRHVTAPQEAEPVAYAKTFVQGHLAEKLALPQFLTDEEKRGSSGRWVPLYLHPPTELDNKLDYWRDKAKDLSKKVTALKQKLSATRDERPSECEPVAQMIKGIGWCGDRKSLLVTFEKEPTPTEIAFISKQLSAAHDERHADDIAVDNFAVAMKAKLAKKRAEGRGGWEDKTQCTQADLSRMLVDHLAKGDPVDVANFAMMLHQRGERILSATHDERRLQGLIDLCGYVENGSDTVVQMFQDDATRSWFVKVGKLSWFGKTPRKAIDAAIAAQSPTSGEKKS